MKKFITAALFIFTLINVSFCQAQNPGAPVEKPENILKTMDSFFAYVSSNLKLSANYTAYDASSKVISKATFLKTLTSGNYLPLRLSSTDAKMYFKLYKLSPAAKHDVGGYIKGWSVVFYDHFKREGKKFPAFNFVDLNGNKYNSKNTKGKIVVLNCWFIGCHACEEEMPELNDLVSQYKNRKDIVFVSLALDSRKKLEAFLKRKPFNYALIPSQEQFISKTLNVNGFPTQFIINKQGTIVSVVETPNEIIYALQNKI
jgi:peroxiredoxin